MTNQLQMTQDSDLSLVELCCQEAGAAQLSSREQLFQRIGRIAVIVGRRFGLDAGDLQNDTFAKLIEDDCRNLRSYRGEAKLDSWLNRILHNLAINMVNKRERERAWFTRIENEQSDLVAEFAKVSFSDLDEYFRKLSAEDRHLIIERGIFNRDPSDLACELGTTRENVNVRYSRALARARKLMEGDFND